ncbi:MAG TPA: nucleotidyltransferase family protein [Candidatus Binatia bacterium]
MVCCTQLGSVPEHAATISELLNGRIDWELLLRSAHQHGILPVLYSQLANAFSSSVPEGILRRLETISGTIGRRNLFFTGELLRLQGLFQRNGIRAIAFKGPALAASIYGNVAVREFSDLDFLMPRDQVFRAAQLLTKQKFVSEFAPTGATQERFLKTQCEMVLTRETGTILVELHWAIAPRYFGINFRLDPIWERYNELPRDGLGFPTLPLEHLFLALTIHGIKHCWERLVWIRDIAQVLRTYPDLDWDLIQSASRSLGTLRVVHLAGALARDIFQVSLPAEIGKSISRDKALRNLRSEVLAALEPRAKHVRKLDVLRFHLTARERFWDRIRYLLRLVLTTTPEDWKVLKFPRGLCSLYYVLRPARLAGKYTCWVLAPLIRYKRAICPARP